MAPISILLSLALGAAPCPPGLRPEGEACVKSACTEGERWIEDACVPVTDTMERGLDACEAGEVAWCRGLGAERFTDLAGRVDRVALAACRAGDRGRCDALGGSLVATTYGQPPWALGLALLVDGCGRGRRAACDALAAAAVRDHVGMLPAGRRVVEVLDADCGRGVASSCAALHEHFRVPEHDEAAAGYARRGCALGDDDACRVAATRALDREDLAEAKRLFGRGCDRGDPGACFVRGQVELREGRAKAARRWFDRRCALSTPAPPPPGGLSIGSPPSRAPRPPPLGCVPALELACHAGEAKACAALGAYEETCRDRCEPDRSGASRPIPGAPPPGEALRCPSGHVHVPGCGAVVRARRTRAVAREVARCAGSPPGLVVEARVSREGDVLEVLALRDARGAPVRAAARCLAAAVPLPGRERAPSAPPGSSYGTAVVRLRP